MNEKRVQVTYTEEPRQALRRILSARANGFNLRDLVFHPGTRFLSATYTLPPKKEPN